MNKTRRIFDYAPIIINMEKACKAPIRLLTQGLR